MKFNHTECPLLVDSNNIDYILKIGQLFVEINSAYIKYTVHDELDMSAVIFQLITNLTTDKWYVKYILNKLYTYFILV